MASIEKRTILVLGTCHVTKATADFLTATEPSKWPCVGGPYATYGWFLYASEENIEGRIPAELFNVMQFARANGCDNILFDCDASEVEGLPKFDW